MPYIYHTCRVALSPRALRGRAERLASAGLDSRCISPAPHAPASRPACRHADLVVRRRRRCCELWAQSPLMQVCGDRLPVPPRLLVGVVLSSIPRRAVCSVSTVPSHVAGAFLSSTPSLIPVLVVGPLALCLLAGGYAARGSLAIDLACHARIPRARSPFARPVARSSSSARLGSPRGRLALARLARGRLARGRGRLFSRLARSQWVGSR